MSDLVFVVDDHRASAEALVEALEDQGYQARAFSGAEPVLAALGDQHVSAIITDLRMDGMDGMDLLRVCRHVDEHLPVIVITAFASIDRAVEATQAGAFAFVTKPIRLPELLVQVRNAVSARKLAHAANALGRDDEPMVGRSAALLHALSRADRAATTNMTVLTPLRARADDVLTLFGIALRRACIEVGRESPRLSSEAVAALQAYRWPGNVRELLNVADRVAVLGASHLVELSDLPPEVVADGCESGACALPSGDFDLTTWLEGLEERALRRALVRQDGVKARAAESLGLERNAFRYKLKKYGIEEE